MVWFGINKKCSCESAAFFCIQKGLNIFCMNHFMIKQMWEGAANSIGAIAEKSVGSLNQQCKEIEQQHNDCR